MIWAGRVFIMVLGFLVEISNPTPPLILVKSVSFNTRIYYHKIKDQKTHEKRGKVLQLPYFLFKYYDLLYWIKKEMFN